jgi:hypothetical protein
VSSPDRPDLTDESYLGDGVWAEREAGMIRLTIDRDTSRERVAWLEPNVWAMLVDYGRDVMGCHCGWSVLGASHPEHVATMYEAAVAAATP